MISGQSDLSLPYAELHCLSNFTFLRGASHPEELVAQAVQLGYRALAITDECSVAGIVRAHAAARKTSLQLIVGSEFTLQDGLRLVLLAQNRQGYGQLCRLISQARRAAVKGSYFLQRDDLEQGLGHCLALWLPGDPPDQSAADWLAATFRDRAYLAVELFAGPDDAVRLKNLQACAQAAGLPLVASSDVHMHSRRRRPLQDALTAIRLRQSIARAAPGLYVNGERHLRSLPALRRLYPDSLLAASAMLCRRIDFSLDELCYTYPAELVPVGESPASHLRKLTLAGAQQRWPGGTPATVKQLISHELALITELGYEHYFLTVHDLVRFARSRGILCQGRGSAANSAVCFCLRITEVDPARMSMLVERFISKERDEPPDIDVDFEHERREEVIQYIYGKYGRDRAALAATVVRYCPRSALRDLGGALDLSELQVDQLAKSMQWWDGNTIAAENIRAVGLDPESPVMRALVFLSGELMGFPRHLSQHVGGFVISHRPLTELVPIENAAMPDRTVIQWDKDDLDELGLLKVDVLGLGMLTAIRRSLDLVNDYRGSDLSLARVPAEDPAVYDMICRADTMGVFQIESRAQMSMLPRLRPRCYYDLVIEVAIVRPGPIQGEMVHPYLRRRNGEEPVTYPSEDVREVLQRTLGVPIFQEQVMQLAIVAAGFTPGEADSLRRAMAAWRRRGSLGPFEQRLIDGMRQRGYSINFARQIFNQILGFGEYGFPESHAASFALLVYVSAWLKHHEPAAFFCALLNSQPMGFYAPSQLVQCARRQGVEVRPVDVAHSAYECTLEGDKKSPPALRLGFSRVKGLKQAAAERIVEARRTGPFASVTELRERGGLQQQDLSVLADADALRRLTGHRHQAVWQAIGVEPALPLFGHAGPAEALPMLRRPLEGEEIQADYSRLGLSLRRHPLALIRRELACRDLASASAVIAREHGSKVAAAGLVISRQRPGSAAGVVFVTLEDETGYLNLVVWQRLAEQQRRILLGASLLGVKGEVQKQGSVVHLVAHQLLDLSELLGGLSVRSRNFH